MLLLRASMIALFEGGMIDAAWPAAETPANSSPANPIAIADFDMAQSPLLGLGSVTPSSNNDPTGGFVQVARKSAKQSPRFDNAPRRANQRVGDAVVLANERDDGTLTCRCPRPADLTRPDPRLTQICVLQRRANVYPRTPEGCARRGAGARGYSGFSWRPPAG
jgi:hypothetical protein